jgi:cobyrinic acid a,c-diamide synthase
VYQIDLWMTGEDDIRRRFYEAARDSDLILMEGVMGLFDGEPSSADIAEKFGIPVMSVIDASAMAGTFGALALGLKSYRSKLPWAGVLANRVASARHAQMLKTGTREEQDWLGAVMKNAAMTLPERHLGLTVASELPDAVQRLDAAADALEETPLGKMTPDELRRWAVEFRPQPHADVPAYLSGKTIAVARDAAFCFLYQANLDLLEQMGAELVFFSPIADPMLPTCDAVWLPGGYPELHAEVIEKNRTMRDSIRDHVAANRPLWAECGGMMVLFEELVQKDGSSHAMWGLLPGVVRMQARLAALGPHQLTLGKEALRGHTFHYSLAETSLPIMARSARAGAAATEDGEAYYRSGLIRASYFHPWFASNPLAAARLFLNEEAVENAA